MNKERNTITSLTEKVSAEFNGILRANLYEIGLKNEEMERLRKRKRELRSALKNTGVGDLFAKSMVKATIKDILTEKLGINSDNIGEVIFFDDRRRLTVKDKFDILLFQYKKKYDRNALTVMLEENNLLDAIETEDGFRYCVEEEDIRDIFESRVGHLKFVEKLDILVQRIYERFRGLGVIDEIRDMNIDGVSGGVSGAEGEWNSVWVFIKGKTVHLKFLDFESEDELKRICMNCYTYGHPGQLSMAKGYIVNEMKDHSRVVVVRPPFSESYAFFVRKFDTIENKELSELITDSCSECVIEVLKWIVKGCQVVGITGAQGSGKTTLLMALIKYIHPAYTLRIQETAFELHLREVYSNRNILTFQETDRISGQEGLDLQKKTDGVVNILGEVSTAPVASWLVQMSMVGSLFTMFTHHAKTTKALIRYLRNSLLSCGSFSNEKIAQEQVVEAVRFDVHMEKDVYGHRYIERISEITGCGNEGEFEIRDIVRFENGRYVRCGDFSDDVRKDIVKNLTGKEKEEFNVLHTV